MSNIGLMLRDTVQQNSLSESNGIGIGENFYSWQSFYRLTEKLASKINTIKDELGTSKKQAVVAIYMDHSVEQALSLFSVSLSGNIFTLINPLLKEENIKHQIRDAEIDILIASDKFSSKLDGVLENRNIPVVKITNQPEEDLKEIHLDTPFVPPRTVPKDVGCYIYTSGSTGAPKGVVVPNATLLDGARIVSGYLGINENERILSILPYSFDYGLNQLLTAAKKCCNIYLHRFLLPNQLLKEIKNKEITALAVVPTIWKNLLDSKHFDALESELSHLRYITTAGGFHSLELLEKIKSFFPHTEIIVMYGLTESFRSSFLPYEYMLKKPGSIGRAVPEVELFVRKDDGTRAQPGEKGELIHRGAFVTYGYLGHEELTRKKFIELNTGGNGCLPELAVRSGDLVHMDEEGFLFFHGRIDQMIKVRGYRISPEEIVGAIQSFKNINNVVAFGVEDGMGGSSIKVAYDTYNQQTIDTKELSKHSKKILPSYAVPTDFLFYESLPLNQNGKFDVPKIKKENGK